MDKIRGFPEYETGVPTSRLRYLVIRNDLWVKTQRYLQNLASF
jgi:hypothetical protein